MENKELEFMECDTCRAKPGSPILCRGCLHNRTALTLADKQGYMRGVEEALRVLPKEKHLQGVLGDNDYIEDMGFNSCLSQAHDAITRLREEV